jgi:hypothetical protein
MKKRMYSIETTIKDFNGKFSTHQGGASQDEACKNTIKSQAELYNISPSDITIIKCIDVGDYDKVYRDLSTWGSYGS